MSYTDFILLLKERFGQLYRQSDEHKLALIDLSGPNYTPYIDFMMILRAMSIALQQWGKMKTNMAIYSPQFF